DRPPSVLAQFDPRAAKIPISDKPPTPIAPSGAAAGPSRQQRRQWAIFALGLLIALVVLGGVLVVVSPVAFAIGYGAAILLALAVPGRASKYGSVLGGLISLLSLAQLALLLGVADLRYGLGRGVGAIDGLAGYASLALVVFFLQTLFLL